VETDREAQIYLALAATDESPRPKLCSMSARILGVTGAGINIATGNVGARVTVCASNRVAQKMEDLQFSLGEGPCIDAYVQSQLVSEPDLAHPTNGRWTSFCPAALSAGVVAVFGIPLRAGEMTLGALNLYRDSPGPLSHNQLLDAHIVARVVSREILTFQSHAAEDSLAEELVSEPSHRLVFHQAVGMIAAQLDVDVTVAALRLRSRAFAEDLSLTSLANAVVGRQVRFS
jgi:hypothetical protein